MLAAVPPTAGRLLSQTLKVGVDLAGDDLIRVRLGLEAQPVAQPQVEGE